MNKKEKIRKIKDLLIESPECKVMLDVSTSIGDLYTIYYDAKFDNVETDIIMGRGEGLENPVTTTVGIEYLRESEIDKILEELVGRDK